MSRAVFLDRDSLDIGDLDMQALDEATGGLQSWGATRPEQVRERIGDAECVIVNKVVLDAELLGDCPALRLICVVATGTNNIDLEAARAHGITVVNCRGYGTASLSQHVLTLILALTRNLLPFVEAVRDGRWQAAEQFCLLDYPIGELEGRTLLIVGHGELGGAVARLGELLGMHVQIAERPGVRQARPGRVLLADALPAADVISLHCPLTEETRNLIDADALARMKPTALLINTARGGIVDEAALADALRQGQIAGAGVDVLSSEPPRDGNPLLAPDIPNLLVTPHCAWGSRTARQRVVDQTVENIQAWRRGEPVRVVAGGA
ncbi:2-hydroxyacid dehydrogenase [Sediminicurvatus halobius]|uniref:2-hydroxyacid dehydrogenase n=1 Tax=Sediminicurvatus halobius TaxID=2182432 RepID=A0A2U2N8V7_9GAMM|nr:2-hydroxyacid dehydrogenase [Spiribacter halobius]PWG65533.1 2-hydroxyacid dehydrogenase [Spiribacter halobius]UEX76558.1 2-hydroxyacid dehydrogenase [Spiribacter halobius]